MDLNQIIMNPWVGFAGTVFGVLSIIVSLVIYFRTHLYQQPAYFKSSIRWYDGTNVPHKDIKLTFRGKSIPRFTITHMAFWNAGNQTIRKKDFASTSPLSLEIPAGVEVFDVRITGITAQEICATLDSPEAIEAGEKKRILINFDYLDRNDGFAVQVIHDADSVAGINFTGKLPGVTEFKSSSSNSRSRGFSTLSYRFGMRHTSLIEKWVFIPMISVGLGGVGIWSIYSAIFDAYHWYQILGGFMVLYLLLPLQLFSEVNPPKALVDAILEKDE